MLKVSKKLLSGILFCTAILNFTILHAAGPRVDPTQAAGGLPVCQSNLAYCEGVLSLLDAEFVVIADDFTRRDATAPSGSGHTVLNNCGGEYTGATASFEIKRGVSSNRASIVMRNARPNTVYDVWLRLKGNGPGGDPIEGSPMTGGGATPLAPGSALDDLLAASWPSSVGTANPINGFTTDGNGDADWVIDLDFPVINGAYPFQKASDGAVQVLRDAGSTWPLIRIPSPIVNPADQSISGPFLLRIVSHCTDNLTHGLSPGVREAWFQYP